MSHPCAVGRSGRSVATANSPPAILLSIVVALIPAIAGFVAVLVVVAATVTVIVVAATVTVVVVARLVPLGNHVVAARPRVIAVTIAILVVRRTARADRQRQQC